MIREIKWSTHASSRLRQRGLAQAEIEATIRSDHFFRESNPGAADWRVTLVQTDGRRFAVLYDNPVDGDESVAKVVTFFRERYLRPPR
jgi:hypothetical protein